MNTEIKIAERVAFSERLKEALVAAGLTDNITKLQRTFNLVTKGPPVTVHAVRKWLLGEAIPTQEKIKELAALANCDPSWLRFGSGARAENVAGHELTESELVLIRRFRRLSEEHQSALCLFVISLTKEV